MTITYANGNKIKAALVVRSENWMRVVTAGSDDVTEFQLVNGTWVSEDCEAVQIEFGPARRVYREHTEEDFVCSKELAAHLIQMLLKGDEDEDESGTPVPSPSVNRTARHVVV
ncbi:MAG TPA: hypothetical protein VLY24_29510 [Bryobacteraceae bacterium]|nr:hypothetical protein [Bryobacteraceae bacterium]